MEIVSPVFLLAAVGFIWVKLGFEYRVQFVTRLAMTLPTRSSRLPSSSWSQGRACPGPPTSRR
jgi:hypothetical protein